MSNVLSAAATGKRDALKTLHAHNMELTINMLARYWRKLPNASADSEEKRIDIILRAAQVSHFNPWTLEEQGLIALRASYKAFGDPHKLNRHSLELKQYQFIYYNPTYHTINIKPLGLTVESVVPGGLVSIPYGLAKGKRLSAVTGIAPQLVPWEGQTEDRILDLTPTSFHEWVTYTPYKPSVCCNYVMLWSEKLQQLVCNKCVIKKDPPIDF